MADNGATRPGEYSESSIREYFRDCADIYRSDDSQGLPRWLLAVGLGAVVLTCIAIELYFSQVSLDDPASLIFPSLSGLLALIGVVTSRLIVRHWASRYKLVIRNQLSNSQLAQRLANGEFVEDEIFSHTPWPWRNKLSGSARDGLRDTISRIRSNLDWYQRPGKVYFPLKVRALLPLFLQVLVVMAMLLLNIPLIMTVFIIGSVAILDYQFTCYLVWQRETIAYFCSYFLAE